MKTGKQRGMAAVELALILPFMLAAAFGITELGRALYQYNTLVKASRDAVRFLAQQDLANVNRNGDDGVDAKTKNLVVCGKLSCANSAPPLLAGLTDANVVLCDYNTAGACTTTHADVETGAGTVDLVTVRIVGFTFTSLVPAVIPNIAFADIKTTMASRTF